MKNSTVFAKAAKIIQESGLAKQCWFFDPLTGGHCLMGAIGRVQNNKPSGYTREIEKVLAEYQGKDLGIVSFNDAPDTTAEEVVQVLQFMALAEKDAGR